MKVLQAGLVIFCLLSSRVSGLDSLDSKYWRLAEMTAGTNKFYFRTSSASSAQPRPGQRCQGRHFSGEKCCSAETPCEEGEGDCDTDKGTGTTRRVACYIKLFGFLAFLRRADTVLT